MVAPISTQGGFARRKGFVRPADGNEDTGALLFETVPSAVLNSALGKVAAIPFGDEK